MKKLSLQILLSLLIIFTFSCKKEVSPEIEITVVDTLNVVRGGVWVKTSVDGAVLGPLNARVLDSVRTDQFGKAFFKYDNTVLVDVATYRNQSSRVKIDSVSILAETKRKKRNDDNVYERTLIFK